MCFTTMCFIFHSLLISGPWRASLCVDMMEVAALCPLTFCTATHYVCITASEEAARSLSPGSATQYGERHEKWIITKYDLCYSILRVCSAHQCFVNIAAECCKPAILWINKICYNSISAPPITAKMDLCWQLHWRMLSSELMKIWQKKLSLAVLEAFASASEYPVLTGPLQQAMLALRMNNGYNKVMNGTLACPSILFT